MHRHCRASCTARAKPDARLDPAFSLLTSRNETHVGRPRTALATRRARTFFAKWRQNFFASACQGGAFSSAESNAKCMSLGGADVPDGAFLALAPLFGADVPALPDLKAP